MEGSARLYDDDERPVVASNSGSSPATPRHPRLAPPFLTACFRLLPTAASLPSPSRAMAPQLPASHFRSILEQETEKLNSLCAEWNAILDKSEYLLARGADSLVYAS